MSRTSKIKESNPELLENEEFAELLASADAIHNIKVIAEMEGGKALVNYFLTNVATNVHRLTGLAETASKEQLVAIIAEMKANLAAARFLTTAKGDLEHLDEMIADTLRS